jgi:putative transcriptional regulator
MSCLSLLIFVLHIFKRPKMSRQTFNRIKEMLARKGKTNIDLAEYMGVNSRTVSSWCTNTNQPEVETLFRISDFLEVEAGDLLTLKKDLKLTKRNVTKSTKGKKPTK